MKEVGGDAAPFNYMLCMLDDLPYVYRAFLSPAWTFRDTMMQVLHRFWIGRNPLDPYAIVTKTFEQIDVAAREWRNHPLKQGVRPLAVAYFGYPKRVKKAACIRFPEY